MKLRTKIALISLLISVFPIVILISFISGYMQNLIILHNQNILKNSIEMTTMYVSNYLDDRIEEMDTIAANYNVIDILEYKQQSETNMQWKRYMINTQFSDIETDPEDYIYIVDENGEVILSNYALYSGISFERNPAFKASLTGSEYLGNAFIKSKSTGKLSLPLAVPVKGAYKKNIGSIIRYIPNSSLLPFFSSYVVSKTGGIFIVDESGNLIITTEANDFNVTMENAYNDTSVSTIKELFSQISGGDSPKSGFSSFNILNEDYYCYYVIYPENNWTVFSSISKSELGSIITNSRLLTIIIGIISSIITFLLSFIFVKNLLSPLSKLNKAVNEAKRDNFYERYTYNKNDEIGETVAGCNEIIDKLENQQRELIESKSLYAATISAINDVAWEYNILTKKFTTTEKWEQMLECPIPDEISFDYIKEFFLYEDDAKNFIEQIDKHINGEVSNISIEVQAKTESHLPKWIRISCIASKNDLGKATYIVGFLSNITDAKIAEEEIRHLAFCDMFTGLYNKYKIQEIIELAIKEFPENLHAYLVVNINNFKQINELYGHDYGDEIIKWVGNKLLEISDENVSIAHYAGDEYRLFYKNSKSKNHVAQFAEKIHEFFKKNIYDNGCNAITITVNIGISIYPEDAQAVESLTQNSDSALYSAKETGFGLTVFYEPYMFERQRRKLEIGEILKNAISKNNLMVYYQPIINLNSKKIDSFEALLRLKSEKYGMIPPSEFIPIAEESEIINEIGMWCLKQVCNTTRELKESGFEFNCIATNISLAQFRDKEFVRNVRSTLLETDVSPSWIKFEITETVLMHSFEHGKNIINLLRQLGIKFALDDFGSGYSSLNYLSELPIDTLKIDKSFIDKLIIDEKQRHIIETIINLAHTIGINVVAEGVETINQHDILKSLDCDNIQGYYFSQAIPKLELIEYMKKEDFYK